MGRSDRTPPTPAEYARYPERFSNRGRWGDDDELGTLNHINAVARREAAALVISGETVSLARPIDTQPGPGNPFPAHHVASVGTSTGLADYIGLFFHGFAHTHIDALSHIPDAEGHFYNGPPVGVQLPGMAMPQGATLGIQRMADGIVTRGVLYDIPRLRGTGFVAANEPVQAWELDDAARAQGITPRAGDVVCIRSGRDEWVAAHPDADGWSVPAGVHASVCEFLYETDAAVLCWDMLDAPTADQGLPNPIDIDTPVHLHCVTIPHMGMPLLDNADFRRLAEVCERHQRWEFLFSAAPLVIDGGTGSPINPIACF